MDYICSLLEVGLGPQIRFAVCLASLLICEQDAAQKAAHICGISVLNSNHQSRGLGLRHTPSSISPTKR